MRKTVTLISIILFFGAIAPMTEARYKVIFYPCGDYNDRKTYDNVYSVSYHDGFATLRMTDGSSVVLSGSLEIHPTAEGLVQ